MNEKLVLRLDYQRKIFAMIYECLLQDIPMADKNIGLLGNTIHKKTPQDRMK